jgi:hypothetical protein
MHLDARDVIARETLPVSGRSAVVYRHRETGQMSWILSDAPDPSEWLHALGLLPEVLPRRLAGGLSRGSYRLRRWSRRRSWVIAYGLATQKGEAVFVDFYVRGRVESSKQAAVLAGTLWIVETTGPCDGYVVRSGEDEQAFFPPPGFGGRFLPRRAVFARGRGEGCLRRLLFFPPPSRHEVTLCLLCWHARVCCRRTRRHRSHSTAMSEVNRTESDDGPMSRHVPASRPRR